MIELDGSIGGGQILRTALSLSAITGKSFKIINIRSQRERPGLKNQHLTCVKAVKEICNANIIGDKLDSKELEFIPHIIRSGKYKFDIGTAGSTALVAQTILPIFIAKRLNLDLELIGGTETKSCPPSYDFDNLFLYFLKKFGADIEFEIERHGFLPKGNGKLKLEFNPSDFNRIELIERASIKKIVVAGISSLELQKANVSERLVKSFKESVNLDCEIKEVIDYVKTYSVGCFIHAYAEFENTRIGLTILGERNKTSEEIGRRCAKELIKEIESNSCIDNYTADQLLIYLGLIGGKIKTSEITDHIKTNIDIIEKFLDITFKIKDYEIYCDKPYALL